MASRGSIVSEIRHVLTPAQERTLCFIVDYVEEHGWPPTLQEIADGTGVAKSTTFAHIRRLQQKGYLVVGRGPRALRVVA